MAGQDTRFRSLFDSSPDAIVIMNDEGIVVEANASLERILGHKPGQLIGTPLSRIMPERYRSAHHQGFRRYLETGVRKLDWSAIELPGLATDGREVPLAIAFGEFEEEGRRFFTATLRDLSADKARRDLLDFLSKVGPELASSGLDYRSTLTRLAQMAVPFLADWSAVDVVTPEGKIERLAVAHSDPRKVALVEQIAARYPTDPADDYGVPQVIRSGRSELVASIHPSFLESVARDAEHLATIRSLGLRSYVIVPLSAHRRIYGALTLVQAESARAFTESDLPAMEELGRRAGLAVHNAELYQEALEANHLLEEQAAELEQQAEEARALSEELEQQAEELQVSAEHLKRMTDDAIAANQAKSAFLASMSHELRTPLNAIGGYVELLEMGLRGPLTAEQRSDLARIRVSQRHLLSLINDVLNFAKIEAGKLEYQREKVLLNEVVDDCVAMLLPQMQSNRIRYSSTNCDPVLVSADRDRVQQILINLLTNAVKFTEPGGAIATSCLQTGAEGQVQIADTGAGMELDQLERIFEPFVQVNRTLSQPGTGVGLGLAISRTLARDMGGDITVTSQAGVGSTFTLALPLWQDEEPG